ncbi:hypothetical protein [Streptomyces sp. SPB4]|uniref:hypothetical protein n=1 Tax=Streptomyces sp. SPB4 TaxID=2940553 RepID=UPI002474852E|nr:hypothetical protein [Streptomyces sp. SPB4]MDH6544146.1 hypothetical protein [Streptomyces sp. SPB4]
MTNRNEPTEGDLLRDELAVLGRHAFPGEEGGMTFLIMAADPGAPDDEDAAYGVLHILMYAGERADRPAADHREPWSAHLHAADGTYLTTLVDGSPKPLDAAADAARCAREVTERLSRPHRGNFPPVARRFCTF